MAQFTVYKSTDTSAPVLHSNADANNMIALLDAILVNGYGSKAAAGWGHPFGTGTATKQVYRPASGTRFYLRVLDDGSMTGARRDCSVRAGESMSDIDTFTNPFPTVAQQTNGVNWRKSADISTTARAWQAYADDRTLYLFVQTEDTGNTSSPSTYALYVFGDYYSYVPSDLYNCILIGVTSFDAALINFQSSSVYSGDVLSGNMQTSLAGHYIARISAGTGSSRACAKKGAVGLSVTGYPGQVSGFLGALAYPNVSDGGLYMHPIWIMDGSTPDSIHGELRGLFHPSHAISNFGDGDTFSGSTGGGFNGKSFVIIKQSPGGGSTGTPGVYILETSNTVRTN